ncbi:MAG: hypothetical protein IPO09_18995 [Anaeromyxobacter sp.]|nr:hypothetical protein [Anaeromyxobacter sp.]MBL0276015.1 hypothetical protein [Anaeromyxobacter sp.]
MHALDPTNITGADRSAYWSMQGRDAPSTVFLPPGQSALWLDPRETSPNVLLGVQTRDGLFVMAPGDVLPVGPGDRQVKVWNQHRANAGTFTAAQAAPLIGYVRLRAVTARDLPFVLTMNGRGLGTRVSQLFAGTVAEGNYFWLPTTNLKGIRFAVVPLSPAGDTFAGAPADFTATLAPRPLLTIGENVVTGPLPAIGVIEPVKVNAVQSVDPDFTWPGQPAETLIASNVETSWDREVVVGCDWLGVHVSAVAGTGTSATRVAVFVEGR